MVTEEKAAVFEEFVIINRPERRTSYVHFVDFQSRDPGRRNCLDGTLELGALRDCQ